MLLNECTQLINEFEPCPLVKSSQKMSINGFTHTPTPTHTPTYTH